MTSGDLQPPSAARTIATLRQQGAHHVDPVRFSHIEALARRAAPHSGSTRRLLDQRLHQLLAAYPQPAAGQVAAAVAAADHAPVPAPHKPTLADLLAHIGRVTCAAAPDAADAPSAARAARAAPELKAVSQYRSTWSRLGAERRLRQALDKVPDNAGPLNTQRLLHEALTVMRDTSPAYLQRFMAHVEALLWLDQLSQGGAVVDKQAGTKKPRV